MNNNCERRYIAYADTGRDFIEFEFYSFYRANSKKNIDDAKKRAYRKTRLINLKKQKKIVYNFKGDKMTIDKIYTETETNIIKSMCNALNLDCTVTRTTGETINYNIVNIPGIARKYENDFKMSFYHLARIANEL